jgi:hypothetical protein
MKRSMVALIAVFALCAIPGMAEAQVRTGIGVGGKMLFPTGELNDRVKTGWGLAATGELRLLDIVSGVGEISYNKFPGEDGTDGAGNEYEDIDALGFTVGGRLYLAMMFVGADVGYFTDIDSAGLLPNIGLRIALLEVMARYNWSGDNWFELRGTVNF